MRADNPFLRVQDFGDHTSATLTGKAWKSLGGGNGDLAPYCITEYGPPGPLEAEQTSGKAPVELTSSHKAEVDNVTTSDILADTRQCLGAYAFLWGSKQEATASWFGMLLPTGEKTITVDAVAHAWTGRWPANRAPMPGKTDVPLAGRRVAGGTAFVVAAAYRDPDGDPLQYAWEVRRESSDRKEGEMPKPSRNWSLAAWSSRMTAGRAGSARPWNTAPTGCS